MENKYLDLAIDKAWRYQLLTYPNPAVGAVVIKDDIILSVEAHKTAGEAHAEVLALKEAYLKNYPNSKLKDITNSHDIHQFLIQNHNNFFNSCEIYVTLEPCNHIGKTPSCANLIKELNLKKVYIGTKDPNKTASGGIDTLKNNDIDTILLNSQKAKDLLYPFEKWQKNRFVFFKIALRSDGSYKDGYITTQDSLNLVHEIRTKLDLLVIGGETVRTDRPTLDSRFSKTKISSDILIYSRKKDFDKTIPLFNIKNRKVTISDKLDFTQKDKLIMIEGGLNLLQVLKKHIDYLVLFVSYKNKNKSFDINSLGFKHIYDYDINQYDRIYFLQNI